METRRCQARHGIPTVRRKPRTGPWVELHTCPKPAGGEMLGATQLPLAGVDDIVAWLSFMSWQKGRRMPAQQADYLQVHCPRRCASWQARVRRKR
jgi:hypothetical protein